MNILITGGTGFIGTHLRTLLLREGHFLTIITRSPEKYENEAAKNQRFVSWDKEIVAEMEKADVVINLVGENIAKVWTDETKKRIYNSRVESTGQLVDAIKKAESRPELLISASGANYYGDRGTDILTEEEPPGHGFLPKLCVDWEGAAREVKELGVRLVIFRNGVVLGKDGGAMKMMLPIFKFGLGGPIGDGMQYYPWVHIQDACRAINFAIMNKELFGACNLSSPNPVTVNELTKVLGDVLNRPAFLRVPEFAVKTVLGETSRALLDSIRLQPKCLQQAGFKFEFEYLEEALQEIASH